MINTGPRTDFEVLTLETGPNLKELIEACPASMNEACIYQVITQLLSRVEDIHKIFRCHGNICPSSIYFGLAERQQVFLADFYYSNTLECDSY